MENFEPIKALNFYEESLKPQVYVPSYIEPRLLQPDSTLLLGGAAKCGKSFLMLEAIRALTTGSNFMSHPNFYVPAPKRVLYVEAENSRDTTLERAKKIFEKETTDKYKDNFFFVSKELDLRLDSARGIRYFQHLIRDVRPEVLLLDPISFLYGGNENDNQVVGSLFYELAKFKKINPEVHMSIVFSHHFGKPPWGKMADGWDELSEYNFRGASKWKDGGDTIITMARKHPKVDRDWEHWRLHMRFLTRHGSSPPEIWTTFNQEGDLRIRFEEAAAPVGRIRKLKVIQDTGKRTKAAVQTDFGGFEPVEKQPYRS